MKVETKFGDAIVSIETGHMARQAGGSVIVRMGETMILATATASGDKREGLDFVPLTVDYLERFYSVGRIPGNFFRREVGRPSEKETLTSRFIDRPCRPLFSKSWTYETQVIAQALSVDDKYDPDLLAMLGASAALTISDIPFDGPIAGARVARVDGQLIVGPTQAQLDASDLTLIVAASREAVVMVEGGAKEASEAEILDAVFLAQEAIKPLLDLQIQLQQEVGKAKRETPVIVRNEEVLSKIMADFKEPMLSALTTKEKQARQKNIAQLKRDAASQLAEQYPDSASDISYALHKLESDI
ncbi:MAG: polyribonucleotide nucleotidyltransferase, partial [Candidatus Adiutrix sp.]